MGLLEYMIPFILQFFSLLTFYSLSLSWFMISHDTSSPASIKYKFTAWFDSFLLAGSRFWYDFSSILLKIKLI